MLRRAPPSPANASAVPSSLRLSRFSAKFNRASGNHRVPGIAGQFSTTRSPRTEARTSPNSQTARQKASGRSTEKR